MIRALFNAKIYVDLVIASTRMFESWDDIVGGDAGFVQKGFLRITDTFDPEAIGGDIELTRQSGEPCEVLSNEQLTQLVPTGRFRNDEFGILFPTGGYADPYKTTVEMADAARRHGAEIREGLQVTGIQTENGRVVAVETDTGTIATPLVVNCAGAWSDRIAAMVGIELPIVIQPASTCLLRLPDSMKTIGPILSDGTNKVYLRAVGDAVYRSAHFGFSAESVNADDYDEAVPAAHVQLVRDGVIRRYDEMRRTPYLGSFTALYDMTPDGHPIVGPIDGIEGFWCDCGWSGNGFAPAPSATRSMAQMIMGGDPEIDLNYFRWPRSSDVSKRTHLDWVHR
jgi:sarcosine oxidase subunit beta